MKMLRICRYFTTLGNSRVTASRLVRCLAPAGMVLIYLSQSSWSEAKPQQPAPPCPPDVQQVKEAQDPLGYRQREGRCEGRYNYRPYSGSVIWLAGFTEHSEDFDPDSANSLRIEWDLPSDESVTIEATSLSPRTFYRMDARPQKPARSFVWPLDVLRGLGLDGSEIGVRAYLSRPVQGRDREVLVPLRVGQQKGNTAGSTLTLLLVSSQEILRTYLLVFQGDTRTDTPLSSKEYGKLQPHGAYGLELPFERPRGPGLYFLDVSVELRDGTIDSLPKIWFLNSPPPPR